MACRRRVCARRRPKTPRAIAESQTSTLQLSYRPPYDWKGILAFLAARALKGIEHVTDSSYARTVQLGEAKGWIRVTQSTKKHALMVEFTHSLTPVLPALLSRVRALFDLNARPDLIAKHLEQGRAPGSRGQGEPRPARARRLQRIRDGRCARSSASR